MIPYILYKTLHPKKFVFRILSRLLPIDLVAILYYNGLCHFKRNRQ